MFAINASYVTIRPNGYQVSFCLPTFYVNAYNAENATKLAEEILRVSENGDDVYSISSYCVN
jgi:hypothetical protein